MVDQAEYPVIGPAVIGEGQFLCWTPCHREAIRLAEGEFERWLPVVVDCPKPGCRKLWTVEFPEQPPGEDAVAAWWLIPRRSE